MLEFAVKLTDHAYKITPRDVDGLRAHGFTDEEIVDIAAAAAMRNFISKLVDALGAEPDASVHELEASLRTALDVAGRLGR
jgi:alkylhydroperoxidase family enzyme